jgi:hypothetical protein
MTELQRLKKILARYEYPASVIECTLKRFMEKKSRFVGSNEKSVKTVGQQRDFSSSHT